MRTAPSLSVIAVGAIFAFAITASPGFLNLQVVGWILMLTGAAGLLLTLRKQSWLRRRIVVRRPAPKAKARTKARTNARAKARELPPPAPASPGDPTQPIERDTFDEYAER
ncbi:MAG TPA: DUF6458 family protein [Streptosporangiaceae bacterium]|nr:DUF6458 family protein [Streptosporangiaceae bacterium]